MATIVRKITFDLTYNGVEYKCLDSGYNETDDIDIDYIHDEDGPWFMLEIGDDILDFQIFGEEDGRLQIDAFKCVLDENGICCEKLDLIRGVDYNVSNIKVYYINDKFVQK